MNAFLLHVVLSGSCGHGLKTKVSLYTIVVFMLSNRSTVIVNFCEGAYVNPVAKQLKF